MNTYNYISTSEAARILHRRPAALAARASRGSIPGAVRGKRGWLLPFVWVSGERRPRNRDAVPTARAVIDLLPPCEARELLEACVAGAEPNCYETGWHLLATDEPVHGLSPELANLAGAALLDFYAAEGDVMTAPVLLMEFTQERSNV